VILYIVIGGGIQDYELLISDFSGSDDDGLFFSKRILP